MRTTTRPDREKLPVTIEITMPLGEWRELYEQLEGGWPSCDLRMAITDAISGIEQSLSKYIAPKVPHE